MGSKVWAIYEVGIKEIKRSFELKKLERNLFLSYRGTQRGYSSKPLNKALLNVF